MDPQIARLHIIADYMKDIAEDYATQIAAAGLDVTWSVYIREEELDVVEIIEIRDNISGVLWCHQEFMCRNLSLAQFVWHYWRWLAEYCNCP